MAELVVAYAGMPKGSDFEQPFLRHMVLALDHYSMHRMRGGKDGNALNEVLIEDWLMRNEQVVGHRFQFCADPWDLLQRLKETRIAPEPIGMGNGARFLYRGAQYAPIRRVARDTLDSA